MGKKKIIEKLRIPANNKSLQNDKNGGGGRHVCELMYRHGRFDVLWGPHKSGGLSVLGGAARPKGGKKAEMWTHTEEIL